MDRRDFFKSILITPLLTPLLLAAKKTTSEAELYLISDSPQQLLPPLLREIRALGIATGRSYAIHNSTPHEKARDSALAQTGWEEVSGGARAHISISTHRLQKLAQPSFTLTRGGRVWDIRTQNLNFLWKEINRRSAPSSLLTVVSFRNSPSAQSPGDSVSLYMDGRRVKSLSLKTKTTRAYRTKAGRITVCVENGRAWVKESSCSHKICVYCPPASFPGERIICAPNHFLLEVNGSSPVDTIIG